MQSQNAFDVIMVYTVHHLVNIVRGGGLEPISLDPVRARRCKYIVFAANKYDRRSEFFGNKPDHRSAFMIAKISGIRQEPEGKKYLVDISEYCGLNIPDAWPGNRNPVAYTTLETLGITEDQLIWLPVYKQTEAATLKERLLMFLSNDGNARCELLVALKMVGEQNVLEMIEANILEYYSLDDVEKIQVTDAYMAER